MTNSRCGSAAEEPKVCQLTAGGNRIRTISPAEKETAVERGPAADHRRLARRPVLNDPIQLSYSIELRLEWPIVKNGGSRRCFYLDVRSSALPFYVGTPKGVGRVYQ
jgi:hypothetical protein